MNITSMLKGFGRGEGKRGEEDGEGKRERMRSKEGGKRDEVSQEGEVKGE